MRSASQTVRPGEPSTGSPGRFRARPGWRSRRLVLALALVALGGCGSSDAGPGGPDGAVPDAGDPDAGVTPDAGPTAEGLAGQLEDEAGQPIANVMVLACESTFCLFGASGADGRFFFSSADLVPPADVALKTLEDLTRAPRRAAALCPLQVAAGARVDAGTLFVPNLPTGMPFGPTSADPQTLTAGDGLQLTLRRADLRPRLGDVLIDVAARRVPEARRCAYPNLGGEVVVDAYDLHPFAATSSSPIAVRAPSDLPAGTAVKFRTLSEIDGHYSDPVPGHADGAFVSTDASVGITELSSLLITR